MSKTSDRKKTSKEWVRLCPVCNSFYTESADPSPYSWRFSITYVDYKVPDPVVVICGCCDSELISYAQDAEEHPLSNNWKQYLSHIDEIEEQEWNNK